MTKHDIPAEADAKFKPPAPFVILPQMKAPPICGISLLPGGGSKVITLDLDEYEGKYIVLIFYAGDWTRICATEVFSYSERKLDFDDNGCEIIFCSTDSHFSHASWTATRFGDGGVGRVEYPIIADRNHTVAKSFGVIKKGEGVAFRATFIIDKKKTIRHIFVNDLAIGRNVDDTLRTLQAIKYRDETRSNCPANWEPTIFKEVPRSSDDEESQKG